jgi:integrase
MGRKVVERDLSTREARKGLPVRTEPYWRNEGEGQHIGYYRGARVGKWVARYRIPGTLGGYSKTTIGEADDLVGRDADGVRVLSWKQAKGLAVKWFASMDAAGGIKTGPYTVDDALDDYMVGFQGKDVVNTQRRIDVLIKPALGRYDIANLTADIISRWHRKRSETPARLRTGAKSASQNEKPLDTPDAKRKRRSTANRDMTVLKAALTVAFRNGKAASDNAWRKVKPFGNVERAKLRTLSDDEARRLVNACDPAFRAMVQAALLTGARYQEIAGAKVVDLNMSAGTLWLTDTKADRPRVCYLEAEGLGLFTQAALGKAGDGLLFPRPDGGRWGASQQARFLRKACDVASITPSATFHDLRRT